MWFAVAQTERVNVVNGVVHDVGVAVPGLGVGGVDGGEAGGVGGGPAALIAVFAGGKIVEAGDGILALAGEGRIAGAGLRVRFAERGVGSAVRNRAVRCGDEAGDAEVVGVMIVDPCSRIDSCAACGQGHRIWRRSLSVRGCIFWPVGA